VKQLKYYDHPISEMSTLGEGIADPQSLEEAIKTAVRPAEGKELPDQ
jgi:hypothetical protein